MCRSRREVRATSKGDADMHTASGGTAEEHTLVIRVYDRFENMGISKSVVKPQAVERSLDVDRSEKQISRGRSPLVMTRLRCRTRT